MGGRVPGAPPLDPPMDDHKFEQQQFSKWFDQIKEIPSVFLICVI